MTAPNALMALLPVLAAVLVAGALRGSRIRRGVLAFGARTGAEDPLVEWIAELRRTPGQALDRSRPGQAEPACPQPADRAADEFRVRHRQPPAGDAPVEQREAGDSALRATRVAVDGSPWPAGENRGASRPAGPGRPGDGAPARLRPPERRDSRRPGGTPAPTAATPRRPGAVTNPSGEEQRSGWLRSDVLTRSPRRTLLLAASLGAGAGMLLAGPVAAVAVGAYGTLVARALLRRRIGRYAVRARQHQLDQLCGLAADLRAGLPVPVAAERLTPGPPQPDGEFSGANAAAGAERGGAGRLDALARAAVRLADQTGAPLAELLERIEADARSSDRGLAAADAQAAGARATALLLAALPLGGIGLGYGIGVDPVAVLLHTPVGGACAVVAIALQVAGLFWAERLGATPGRVN
ncbi:hypothetical protein OG777_09465 [Micromonospora peucetia]|uniref:hypothetical protein n=1 Tax=Micromonospora peucetia TaxID=47871 RepID=UPI0022540E52|nr:hypothetical protein [Micromonospora peucetia]MCX4387156.1 hypothetical protein [Micromonospora peucetia]